MEKKLIIAEKPSVAADIAKAIGGFTKHDDYYENDDYVLSSAIGHLLEITVPDQFEVKRGKWSFAHLPVIPPHFELKTIEKTESRLKLLVRLIKRKDVTGLINACDAGREGELIFRYIAQYAGTKKHIERLWLQSMETKAIRYGFEHLRTDESMRPLESAARCRSEADWLVGINGTRVMTAFNSQSGGFQLTTVGRVQTPTLAVLVEREHVIRQFVVQAYWELHGVFSVGAGTYTGRWINENFTKNEQHPEQKAERIWDETQAQTIAAACLHKPATVKEEQKATRNAPPLLYHLTSLQRDANNRFGFSAKATLGVAQALYEKHKVLTYPRTDSRALPEDTVDTIRQTLSTLASRTGEKNIASPYQALAAKILDEHGVHQNNSRIFNSAKVSDHFAIIPTGVIPKALSEPEQKIYDMVMKRFLAVFYPAAEYLITTRMTYVAEQTFRSEGKVITNPGWRTVYGVEVDDENEPPLVPIVPDEPILTTEIHVNEHATHPPARYNEATLLSAMEGAGKLVDDSELREAMANKGLGTPATRAAIIEGLVEEKYVFRQGRELMPTAKATSLMTLLKGLSIPELTSAELTGEWEHKLAQIEQGSRDRASFMDDIRIMTERIVSQAKNYDSDTIPGDFETLTEPCPKCEHGTIRENYKKYQCQSCDFSLWKIVAGRQFEGHEITQLLQERRIGPLTGFRSRQGRAFSAAIFLDDTLTPQFDFGDASAKSGETVDLSNTPSIGHCPKCQSNIHALPAAYTCAGFVAEPRSCDFRIARVILQRPIEEEQVLKLLQTGSTDLLTKFISKKGRPFSAFLIQENDGKIGFKFEEKAPKKPAAKKSASTTRRTKKVADKED